MKHLALFGGTFSPIHQGHINMARALQEHFQFDQFIFLPNKAPVIDKLATASSSDRLKMLQLALAPYPLFKIDERELHRKTPSFMIETLLSLHKELGNSLTKITLIIGMDSFLQFHRWHDWKTLFTLCNLIVLKRPKCRIDLPAPLREELAKGSIHAITDEKELTQTCGGFYYFDAGAYNFSSTTLRELIAAGQDVSNFIPPSVLDYIKDNALFGYRKP